MINVHYSPYTSLVTNASARRFFGWRFMWLIIVLLLLICWSVTSYLDEPPQNQTLPAQVTIEPGSGVRVIAQTLAEADIIRSARWFSVRAALFHNPTTFQAGVYEFTAPQPTVDIIDTLQRGEALPQDVQVTLIEGQTRDEYATSLSSTLTNFQPDEFLRLTADEEGYLFPDTYRFHPESTAADVFNDLRTTYETRTEPLSDAIAEHVLSEADIVNLASILEKEANSATTMRMVSGILQNRLAIGMALQADATIGYVLDKPLSDLVPSDLDRESPYNTYLYTGLPPTPISNPGLEALRAVLEPTPSEYLYYITGNDGNFYYAQTYAEHQRNIARYLR